MDIKITKKRLSDMLAYEWVIIVAVIVAAIFLWELLYSVLSVKLTPGQQFYVFYDSSVLFNQTQALQEEMQQDHTLSYDVLETRTESIVAYGILDARLTLGLGDVIISTSNKENEEDTSKAEELVERYNMYTFDKLLSDAKEYLTHLSIDGNNIYDFENGINKQTVTNEFLFRMQKDNRFRTQAQKEEGVKKEYERIKKICLCTKDLETLLQIDDQKVSQSEESLFFRCVKGEEGRYGLKAEMLTGGANVSNASKLFAREDNGGITAQDVVIMIFDLYGKTEENDGNGVLQFEVLSFISTVVKSCSNLLND